VSGASTLSSIRVGTTNASDAPFIFTFDSNSGVPDGSFRNLSFYNYTGSAQATGGCFTFAGNNLTQTSGSQIFINTVNSFTPTSGTASLSLLRLGWTINQTGGANGITRGLYINPILTAAADWRSIEWVNNSGWGLYGAGTAPNYLGGNLGIGTTSTGTSSRKLSLSSTASTYMQFINTLGRTVAIGNDTVGSFIVYDDTAAAYRLVVSNGGNLLLGSTTDAGFRLDVNGTARFTDNARIERNFNGVTQMVVSNTTSGTAAEVSLNFTTSTGNVAFAKYSAGHTPYKIFAASDSLFYNGGDGDLAFLNDFATGRIKFAAGGSSTAHMTLASNGNLLVGTTTDSGQKLKVAGNAQVNHAYTHAAGAYTSGLSSFTDVTTGSSPSYTSGMFYGAFQSYYRNQFSASATIPNSAIQASQFNGSQIRFVNSGTAITMTQAAGIRAYASQILQFSVDNAQATCSVSHVAGIQIIAPYYQGANNPTISNYYGLVLNDSAEYSATLTVTNRWAIYQDGASDNNYFKGKVVIGSTNTVGASPLNVKNLPTSSTGLASGDIWSNSGVLNVVP
jgi:hypothetical protein